jgi:hypothetical protein
MIDEPSTVLAYVAGLFDGEGSIVIGVSKPKKDRKNPSYWLQVGITNTDKELIDWLHARFGGHISDNSHCPSRKRQRPCWAWRIIGNQAREFLTEIIPYLRTKKQQAEIAIAFQEYMSSQKHRQLSEDDLAIREQYRIALRSLTLGAHTLPA